MFFLSLTAVTAEFQNNDSVQSCWSGFEIPARWNIGSDGKGGFVRTQYPDAVIADPAIDAGNKRGANSEGENAKSTLKYPNGFTLDLEFIFDPAVEDKSQIPPTPSHPYGYVPISRSIPNANRMLYPKKLSFVANSGVKFGNAKTQTEAAILDVVNMVAMAGGLDAFKWNAITGKGIDKDGFVIGMTNPAITGIDEDGDPIPFEKEHVTKLMSHVIYGGDPATMADYLVYEDFTKTTLVEDMSYGGDPTTMTDYLEAEEFVREAYNLTPDQEIPEDKKWEVWWHTLRFNVENFSNRLTVDITKENGGFCVKIWRGTGESRHVSCEYNTSDYSNRPEPVVPERPTLDEKRTAEMYDRMCFTQIDNISLQSHWCSGVKFMTATLTAK